MKKNRKNRKMIFILLLISFITITYAVSYKIDKSGTLSNVVNGLSTSRNKIEDKKTFGSAVIAQMLNVNKVTGANAEGGIRVKTIAKKYNLGIVTNTEYLYIPVYPTTTNSSSALFTYNSSKNTVKITWEDWTGNTSFNARFVAYNKN